MVHVLFKTGPLVLFFSPFSVELNRHEGRRGDPRGDCWFLMRDHAGAAQLCRHSPLPATPAAAAGRQASCPLDESGQICHSFLSCGRHPNMMEPQPGAPRAIRGQEYKAALRWALVQQRQGSRAHHAGELHACLVLSPSTSCVTPRTGAPNATTAKEGLCEL